MKYAIETLEKEINIIENALSKWDELKYPKAKKERESRLKSLITALNLLNGGKTKHYEK